MTDDRIADLEARIARLTESLEEKPPEPPPSMSDLLRAEVARKQAQGLDHIRALREPAGTPARVDPTVPTDWGGGTYNRGTGANPSPPDPFDTVREMRGYPRRGENR